MGKRYGIDWCCLESCSCDSCPGWGILEGWKGYTKCIKDSHQNCDSHFSPSATFSAVGSITYHAKLSTYNPSDAQYYHAGFANVAGVLTSE